MATNTSSGWLFATPYEFLEVANLEESIAEIERHAWMALAEPRSDRLNDWASSADQIDPLRTGVLSDNPLPQICSGDPDGWDPVSRRSAITAPIPSG